MLTGARSGPLVRLFPCASPMERVIECKRVPPGRLAGGGVPRCLPRDAIDDHSGWTRTLANLATRTPRPMPPAVRTARLTHLPRRPAGAMP